MSACVWLHVYLFFYSWSSFVLYDMCSIFGFDRIKIAYAYDYVIHSHKNNNSNQPQIPEILTRIFHAWASACYDHWSLGSLASEASKVGTIFLIFKLYQFHSIVCIGECNRSSIEPYATLHIAKQSLESAFDGAVGGFEYDFPGTFCFVVVSYFPQWKYVSIST